jgi:hypothetical protein
VWIESPDDGRRCTICGELAGKTSEIDGEWMSSEVGAIKAPPAHPSCRCTMGLVTDLGKRATHVVIKGDFVGASEDDQRLVFGWLSVVEDEGGAPVVDTQGDVIPADVMEQAVYQFMLDARAMGDMHERIEGIGRVVESMFFSRDKLEALGLVGRLPVGWWVGFYVDDDETWAAIKGGDYQGLSIGGVAYTEPAESEAA